MTRFVSKKGALFSKKSQKIISTGVSNPKLAFFVVDRDSENELGRVQNKKGSGKTTPL